ncbi:MAG: hypothetical protein JWR69_3688, partial [Pedosphaera sp.]|nr:hypothetical protein [Pedosphaera sp.]
MPTPIQVKTPCRDFSQFTLVWIKLIL